MSDSSAFTQGALASMLASYSIVIITIVILTIIAMWKIFTKAGKPGWASIVPIYNMVVLFQIVGLNPWLLLLCIVPIINSFVMLILSIMMNIRLAKAFGKSTGFAVGLIFLNTVFTLILGFGDSKYVGIPE